MANRKIMMDHWRLKLTGVSLFTAGFVVGSYLMMAGYLENIQAANTLTSTFELTNSGDYVVSDSSLIEVSGGSARLKIREYSSDAQTELLLHLNESSGNPADTAAVPGSPTATSVTYEAGKLNNGARFNGTSSQVSVADSTHLSLTGNHTIEAWAKLDTALAANSHTQKQGIVDKGDYRLYYDQTTGKLVYELANSSATTWTQQAGNDIKNSWDLNGKNYVRASIVDGSDLYVAVGGATADAEVWKWDGTIWSQIGGDGKNASWSDQQFENVWTLAINGNYLYAGLGDTAGDAEVWRCDKSLGCSDWDKIGGDGVNSSWAINTYEWVMSSAVLGGNLYVGIGSGASEAEVWRYNGTTWAQVGGDSLNSGWTTNYDTVWDMISDGTYIYASIGDTTTEAEVYRYNGTAWTKIGGDGLNSSWNTNYEQALSLAIYGAHLYVGLGNGTNDAEVWRASSYTGTPAWSQVGGDGLGSSWNTSYEGVYSLTADGTYLYAGIGNGDGDGEIYRYNGTAWTKIGGDAVGSSWASALGDQIWSLVLMGGNLYAGVSDTAGYAAMWSYNGTTWTMMGGQGVNSSWGFFNLQSVETLTAFNGYLYAGTGQTVAGNAMVWQYDGSTWSIVGGQGVKSSWATNTYEWVMSMVPHKGYLYVGLGSTANDAEVWRYNGTVWEKVGGDSINTGWTTNYEGVYSLASFNDKLYAGLGNSTTEAEVWEYNGTAWTKVGGDGVGSSWNTTYETVWSLSVYDGQLYAGIGISTTDAEVWRYNGTAWTKVGGDGVGSSWNTVYEQVNYLTTFNNKLYAGIGTGTDDAEVWEYNGTAWTKVGGDDVNGSWTAGTYEEVRTMTVYNGELYVGIGTTAGDGEVWRYNGSSWTQLGGDGLNAGWDPNVIEYVSAASVYKGKMYVGTGNSANADAAIWSFGNNGYLESSSSSQDTNWHHLAATYDGATMRLYVDGVESSSTTASVTIPDSTRALLVGNTYGAVEGGVSEGFFDGMLDEVRISNTVRSEMITTPYTNTAQTVTPAAAVFTTGVSAWEGMTATESLDGGSVNYRVSTDGGTTWKYWNGSAWATSASTSQANSYATINTNLPSLALGSAGFLWQAVLLGNGNQLVAVDQVQILATEDVDAPTPPNTLTALSQSGGTAITTATWYNHATPYFSFAGADDGLGSGVEGYYVYFGTDETAVPQTAGTWQVGTSYTASSLTSGQTYYLRIQAKDVAGNYSTVYAPFNYKYDASVPTNPSAVVVSPAGYSQTNEFTFNWTAGADSGSGVAGYQYKTGASSGALSDWSAVTTGTTVTLTDGAYQIDQNVFYLRVIDNAGNVSASPMTVNYYFAGDGPSAPQFLTVTPQDNTENSFAFYWQAPTSFSGDASDLTYCYTVNVLPSSNTCTYTSAGVTALSASSFATNVGLNTFYLAARNPTDLGGAIAYSNYTSVTFTANTSAPGIPQNIDIADISIKSTSMWRLTISYAAPASGAETVSRYQIMRSTDDVTYTTIANTTGLAYVDTGLTQQTYYYKVKACDSVNNCGIATSAVSMLPTGKYTEAANLSSGPTVSSITTKKAVVSWVTDRTSDSRVSYGTAAGSYFDEEPSNSDQVSDHEIALNNLTPGTTYYLKTKWTDEDGNLGTSNEVSFTTAPAPTVSDVTVKKIGLSTATINLTVLGASSVKIYYGPTAAFGGVTTQATAVASSTYDVELTGLLDGTKYFYQVNSYDAEGNVYEGTILTFTTLPRPKISAVRIQQVKGAATSTVLVSWTSNTETSSIVTYFPVNNPAQATDKVDLKLVKTHQVVIRDMLPETDYTLLIKGRDKAGNEAVSDPQKLTTATDTRPPVISNVKVEPVVQGVGEEATAQLVVSWDTDELSTSQVVYGEGSSGALTNKTQRDEAMTFNHLVVVPNLQPSRVYHLKVLTADKVGNESQSIDQVVITPKSTKSALNLVIGNLSQAFGFLGGIAGQP